VGGIWLPQSITQKKLLKHDLIVIALILMGTVEQSYAKKNTPQLQRSYLRFKSSFQKKIN
jgi:hypothetical protein